VTIGDGGTVTGSFAYTGGTVSNVLIDTTAGTFVTTAQTRTTGAEDNASQITFTDTFGPASTPVTATLVLLLGNGVTFGDLGTGGGAFRQPRRVAHAVCLAVA